MRAPFLVFLVLGFVGCSEIAASRATELKLKKLIDLGATVAELNQEIPLEWVRYEIDSDSGKLFGADLIRRETSEFAPVKSAWSKCDFALYHTTESTVTIVFVRSNVVFFYYLGSQ
jgi:hypothetical protein